MSLSPRASFVLRASGVLAAAVLGAGTARARPEEPPLPPPAPADAPSTPATEPAPEPAAPKASPTEFPSPAAAAAALVQAFEKNDDAALRSLVGEDAVDLVQTGDDPAVRRQREELAAAARVSTSFRRRPDGRLTIVVGSMAHPLAIPLVPSGTAWRLDVAAGREELLARRIGENETDAVGLCLACVQAQRVYGSRDRDGDGVLEYAQRIVSTPGQRDGLYWEAVEGEEPSPAGSELDTFREGIDPVAAGKAPFGGYYWKVLTAAGPRARAGEGSFLQGENMVRGFGLLAVPAVHRNTGVVSLLVGPDGRVLEKDLGADTLEVAASMDRYDPDPSWTPVDAETLRAAAESAPGTLFDERTVPAVVTGGPGTPVRPPGAGGCPR